MSQLRSLTIIAACGAGLAMLHVADSEVVRVRRARDRARAAKARIDRGRAIFQRGEVAGRALVGIVGAERIPIEGALVACARCHGEGGEGEAGMTAPPLHARALFAAVAPGTSDRPARPAYDVRAFARAVREGRSASDRELSWIMPRFELSPDEIEDLVAYLRALESEPAPGVEPDRIRIGTILPADPGWRAASADVRAVLEAAFEEVNREGGVRGRRLELVVLPPEFAREAGRAVFALASTLHPEGASAGVSLERLRLPVIGPMGAEGANADAAVFPLVPGADEQARWAVQRLDDDEAVAVVHSSDRFGEAWARAAIDECARRARPVREIIEVGPGAANAGAAAEVLRASSARTALVAVPPAEFAALVEAAPGGLQFVAPGALAREDLPVSSAGAGRVRFVYPALLASVDGVPRALREFLGRNGLEPTSVAFQINAYATAQVVAEALRRAGAQPTRASFVRAVESLRDFHTGVTPPLTFGAARRVGAQRARWARLDPSSRALVFDSDWVALSP